MACWYWIVKCIVYSLRVDWVYMQYFQFKPTTLYNPLMPGYLLFFIAERKKWDSHFHRSRYWGWLDKTAHWHGIPTRGRSFCSWGTNGRTWIPRKNNTCTINMTLNYMNMGNFRFLVLSDCYHPSESCASERLYYIQKLIFSYLRVFHVATASLHAIRTHVRAIECGSQHAPVIGQLALRCFCCFAEAWMACVRMRLRRKTERK